MRSSDFILGDKIYVPISTLHRLNIELDSISYIECSETSNQPILCRRWAPPGAAACRRGAGADVFCCVVSPLWREWNVPMMSGGPALLVIRLSIRKHAGRLRRAGGGCIWSPYWLFGLWDLLRYLLSLQGRRFINGGTFWMLGLRLHMCTEI